MYDTDKFTIDQFCGEVTVHFHDRQFFSKVKKSLIEHYPTLRRQLTSKEPQYFTDHCGHDVSLTVSDDVSLTVNDDSRSLLVSDDGALSWTMRDFQMICRNITLSAG